MNNDKWVFEETGNEYWSTSPDEYDTKEEAIEGGREYFLYERNNYGEHEDMISFSVGQIKSYNPYIDGENVLEQIRDHSYEEVGELAENYLARVNTDELALLEDELQKVLLEWMDKTDNKPNFWKIRNVEDNILLVD